MATTGAFEKRRGDVTYKCASDITDTTLAYTLSTTDGETVILCGDNQPILGFPDRRAKAGEPFLLRWKGDWEVLKGTANGAIDFTAGGFPLTSAASGKLRKAVIGSDLVQGYNRSITTTDGDKIAIHPV